MNSGETLRLMRKWKKLSQADLAKRVDKSQEMISHLEQQEHINGEMLSRLLKGLDSNREEWERFRKLPPSE
jgi:transcriptional regulator with XRE-family HTH domain